MSREVANLLAGYSPEVREIALTARDIVRKVLPRAIEKVVPGWRVIVYSLDGKMSTAICAVIPLKTYVNLGFYRGADLIDPQGLLEGTGKKIRHIKLTSPKMAELKPVRDLIKAAGRSSKT